MSMARAARRCACDATAQRSDKAPGMRHCMSWPSRGAVQEQFWFKAGKLVEYRHVALETAQRKPSREVTA